MKFLNWTATDDAQDYFSFGPEGRDKFKYPSTQDEIDVFNFRMNPLFVVKNYGMDELLIDMQPGGKPMKDYIDKFGNTDYIDQVFLIRRIKYHGTGITVLSGHDRTGTLYAVYSFLEMLGFRWYAPGEAGMCRPPEYPESFPETDLVENPAFITRGCYSGYLRYPQEELIDWAARNRLNYVNFFSSVAGARQLKKRGMQIGGGGHHLLSGSAW